jgi:circadian clock protein KaiC
MQLKGALTLIQVDAADLSAGEFAHRVRACVEDNGALTVVMDSLSGYRLATPDEPAPTISRDG